MHQNTWAGAIEDGLDIACGGEDGDTGERVRSPLSIGEGVALLGRVGKGW